MLTRRQLLRSGLLAALGAGLSSCDGLQRLAGIPSAEPTATTTPPPPTPTLTAEAPPTPTATPTPIPELLEARYYVQLDGQRVQCQVCFRRCTVPEGGRGFCRNKVNIGGRYYTLVYSRPSALQLDPIEKEPHFHMWPGATIFCTGTAGCNNRCKFCQNWHLSQRSFEEIDHTVLTPGSSIALALQRKWDAVSFTYNEPTVFYEHMFDVASLAKRVGLGTLFHTNGGMNAEPLAALLEHMDAVTVDLKAFTPEFYRDVSSSELEPVLRTLKQIHESKAHLEIVNLVIPTLNDELNDIRRMCHWICDTLSDEVPLHFTRFHPAYKLTSLSPTPIETLESAAQVADEAGLQYVYVGNVPGHERNSTFCPDCGKKIIGRVHFSITSLDVVKGKCGFCGHTIPGVWRDA
ncbi:MAG TPA: AmmeMemoRadiSam system radical SAM enzyme [Anaerolineae bacterium]|nr:AmmeMemoRadiSam system radical SAM enzyme [Anaerolineae bacterium]